MTELEIRNILDNFATAWSACDVEAVMDLMTEDCIYEASAGPEPGTTGFHGDHSGQCRCLADHH